MSSQLENVNGKDPIAKVKNGRFEVSIWHWRKIIPQPRNVKDLFAEREVDVRRACIRYSRWNRMTRQWQETRIWCDIDDLRSLVNVLNGLNEAEIPSQTSRHLEPVAVLSEAMQP